MDFPLREANLLDDRADVFRLSARRHTLHRPKPTDPLVSGRMLRLTGAPGQCRPRDASTWPG